MRQQQRKIIENKSPTDAQRLHGNQFFPNRPPKWRRRRGLRSDGSETPPLLRPLFSETFLFSSNQGSSPFYETTFFLKLCCNISSVQSLDQTSHQGEHDGQFSRDSLLVFSAEGPCEQFWYGQGCQLFDVVHLAFPLPTTASATLQGALKDGFREAVVACVMSVQGNRCTRNISHGIRLSLPLQLNQ